jgi:hypothetical protein
MAEQTERDRPSRHGQALGDALWLLMEAGKKDFPGTPPECCATCAFRRAADHAVCAENTSVQGMDRKPLFTRQDQITGHQLTVVSATIETSYQAAHKILRFRHSMLPIYPRRIAAP